MRYLLALPLTIIFWYGATGLLTGITIAINEFQPPGENQIYSQGYWYAIIASCLYMTCSMLLMVNMLGYFLGHYPQNFILTDDQRQLILQTMIFFVWLGGGGAVFANTDDMKFVDAVYFCGGFESIEVKMNIIDNFCRYHHTHHWLRRFSPDK